MTDPDRESQVRRSVRLPNWTTLALVGGLVVLVLLIAYFASRGNPNQDKLTEQQLAENSEQASAPAPEKLCASKQTYDLIKRELFRHAAQLRGSDQAAFDQLSAYAVLRMENPVMESQDAQTHAVNCSGTLSLDLPPGVAIVGSRRTLTTDVDYTVQPAADGSGNVVLLRNADAIITPLATLARARQPNTQAPAPETAGPGDMEMGQVAPDQAQAPADENMPATQSGQSSGTQPSFDCDDARTKGEIAVCSDSGLASLDRNMAGRYQQAMSQASPEQRALLRRTRDRFLAYRNRCPDTHCVAQAYLGRIREIRDIMEGDWQPPR